MVSYKDSVCYAFWLTYSTFSMSFGQTEWQPWVISEEEVAIA